MCCVITAPSRPTHSRPTQNVSHGIAETRLEPYSTRTQCGCGSAPCPGSTAGPRFHRNRVEVLELGVGTRCTMCRASLSAASPDKQRVPLRPPLRCLSTICRFNRTTNPQFKGPVGSETVKYLPPYTPDESRTLDIYPEVSGSEFVYFHLPDVCDTHTHGLQGAALFEDICWRVSWMEYIISP